MRKLYMLAAALLVALTSFGQISLSGTSYSENFNSLANTGTGVAWTDNVTILGWYSTRTAYNANDGSGNSGALYSFGTGTNTDRAIGSLASGSTNTVYYGARFINSTSTPVTNIQISYKGEQWRNGGNTSAQSIKVYYQIGTNLTSLTAGTWTAFTALDFTSPVATATAAALNGNDAANSSTRSATLTGVSLAPGEELFIRWEDLNDAGNDHGLAVDDFSITYAAGSDVTPPTIVSLLPANNNIGTPQNFTASITFNELISKGTGNINIYRASDNAVVQTIDVATSAVTVSGASVSFSVSNLSASTSYYITLDNGAIKDASNNNFSGISGSGTWTFTTGAVLYSFQFTNCTSALSDGFAQQSTVGAEVWLCTTFGRSGNGVQINGFNSGNQNNDDWLVSPAVDLSATSFPILSFYSRSRFAGDVLRVYVTSTFTGDVSTTTWTELNGRFPTADSDVWTLSDNIDLSAFKSANVRIAFRYTSSTSAASRWTLDDISITNSATPALPVLASPTTLIDLRQIGAGNTSAVKSFSFSIANLTNDLTVTAPSGFELSKEGTTFTNSIQYTPAEVQYPTTAFVRFAPASSSTSYAGELSFTATGFAGTTVFVKGNSYDPGTTLNVVNWNIEWFGSPANGQGPADDDLAQANAKKVMDALDADVYAVAEIVNVTRFSNLVSSLAGSYNYVIGEYCSGGTTAAACNTSQKLALVYKTSVLSNVTARPMLISSTQARANWASGRVPFLVTGNVTKNGQTTTVHFIVVHAKANTGNTQDQVDAYFERKAGVQELKDTLDTYYANSNVVILGDFNDDLDRTIAPTTGADTVSSYLPLITDSTDGNHYRSLTLPLSNFKLSSTTSNPEMIDHVIISNEMAARYVGSSASLYNDIDVVAGISNYAETTSDHYPVLTRFRFGGTLPVKLTSFTASKKQNKVYLTWSTSQEINAKEFVVERSADGRRFEKMATVAAKGNSNVPTSYQAIDDKPQAGNNYYRLMTVDYDNKTEQSNVVKIHFAKGFTVSLAPNPASHFLVIDLANRTAEVNVQITDASGRLLHTAILSKDRNQISLNGWKSGLYLVKVTSGAESYTEKL
ncbi:MAG TPA: choice-of-anchor J domain-containing protein, partial [Flavisolibacter sp.]|nr:choice-of-anchor J domain-containing protein [Flavisolibacter sp.]